MYTWGVKLGIQTLPHAESKDYRVEVFGPNSRFKVEGFGFRV